MTDSPDEDRYAAYHDRSPTQAKLPSLSYRYKLARNAIDAGWAALRASADSETVSREIMSAIQGSQGRLGEQGESTAASDEISVRDVNNALMDYVRDTRNRYGGTRDERLADVENVFLEPLYFAFGLVRKGDEETTGVIKEIIMPMIESSSQKPNKYPDFHPVVKFILERREAEEPPEEH